METETIVVPEEKTETILQPEIVYHVPAEVMVLDAQTFEVMDIKEITVAEATKVILVPAVAGG